MIELRKLEPTQALGLITGFIIAYKSGRASEHAFTKLALEALRDGRVSLITPIASEYPIPQFERHQDPEKTEMEERLTSVRETMPGVYGPVHAASYRMQQTIKEVDAQLEAQSPLVDYQKELSDKLDDHPVWRAMLLCPIVAIRMLAISRLGAANNPLKEAAVVYGIADAEPTIRQHAKTILGQVAEKPRKYVTYSAKDVVHRGSVPHAISQVMQVNTDEELREFFNDPRPQVRFAAVCRLQPDSTLWPMAVNDLSVRIRRIAAERVRLGNTEVIDALLKDAAPAVRKVLGKRLLAIDINIAESKNIPRAMQKQLIKTLMENELS